MPLRYIRTTLSLAVMQGIACEFDAEFPNLIIEYSDSPEIELVAVYVGPVRHEKPLPAWLIEAMGEQLLDLCRRHSETPPASTLTALRDSAALAEDDLAEIVSRRNLPVLGLRPAAE